MALMRDRSIRPFAFAHNPDAQTAPPANSSRLVISRLYSLLKRTLRPAQNRIMTWTSPTGRKIVLKEGDITRVPADAIVNAANSALAGGGGVDGAIHRAGGPEIMHELDAVRARIGRCPTGSAVATGAGKLPAKFVFHAVGPVYRDGAHGEPERLASCYRKAFELAEERSTETISFPAISTGVYGYPLEDAAAIAIREVMAALEQSPSVREAIFVLFGREAYDVYAALLKRERAAP
jgi:O-acetyl-ADP-ribose deacetylase (regulator of RNase III)